MEFTENHKPNKASCSRTKRNMYKFGDNDKCECGEVRDESHFYEFLNLDSLVNEVIEEMNYNVKL